MIEGYLVLNQHGEGVMNRPVATDDNEAIGPPELVVWINSVGVGRVI